MKESEKRRWGRKRVEESGRGKGAGEQASIREILS